MSSVKKATEDNFDDNINMGTQLKEQLELGQFDKNLYVKGRELVTFSNEAYDNSVKAFISNMATVRSLISGDNTKSVVKSLSGNNLPITGILSVSFDDNTNFAEVQQSIQESDPKSIPVSKNLFIDIEGSNQTKLHNRKLITGQNLRTAIGSKTRRDKFKEAAKMSAAEIFTQSILFDFYQNLSTKGEVSLQPLVYADKIGQLLKNFKMTGTMKYEGVEYDLDKIRSQQLKTLHQKTVGGQYSILLIDDVEWHLEVGKMKNGIQNK